jgi:hypothetical protein
MTRTSNSGIDRRSRRTTLATDPRSLKTGTMIRHRDLRGLASAEGAQASGGAGTWFGSVGGIWRAFGEALNGSGGC